MAPLSARLTNVANKLRMMWGQNPDSDVIMEVVALVEQAEAKAAPETTEDAPEAKTTPSKKSSKANKE